MTLDPYAALDLPRDATPADVKRAFRRKAKKHHPDAGGSAKDFDTVVRANLVLSNPARRARFDHDGVIDETSPNLDPLREAKDLIVTFFLQAAEAPGDIFQHDMVAAARKNFEHHIAELTNAKTQQQAKIRKRQKIVDRLKHKDANDFVRRAIRFETQNLERNLVEIDRQVQIRRDAILLLQDYRFEQEGTAYYSPSSGLGMWTTASTT